MVGIIAALAGLAIGLLLTSLFWARSFEKHLFEIGQQIKSRSPKTLRGPDGRQTQPKSSLGPKDTDALDAIKADLQYIRKRLEENAGPPSPKGSDSSSRSQATRRGEEVERTGEEELIRLFNEDRDGFEESRKPCPIAVVGRPAKNEMPRFTEHAAGTFWAFRNARGDHLIAPNPKIGLTSAVYHDAGLKATFECRGWEEDRQYAKFRLIKPAMALKEDGGWRCTVKGELELVAGTGVG